jgi:hypothetical protein
MNPLIYQTVSFSDTSKAPTEEHTELAIKNCLRTPNVERFHQRIWFPHRAGMAEQWWDWLRDNTHFNMGPGIRNCKHIAVWVMVPEEAHVHEKYKDGFGRPIPTSAFRHCDLGVSTHLMLAYYTFLHFQAYEYARTMTELGYNVGFAGCIQNKPKSFNRTFGSHFKKAFKTVPVIPHLAVFVGTDGDVVQHCTDRDKIADLDVGGEVVGVPDTHLLPDYVMKTPDTAYVDQPYFKLNNGDLESLSEDEVYNVRGIHKANMKARRIRD